ncbi:MAG: anthranilate phosphoribosyltransferase [Blastocatellia bacterium]
MLTSLLNRLIARENLTQAEAAALLDALLGEDATDARIAAALTALAEKGETEEELAGFAETMRARSARVTTRHARFIDTCGTGGSPAKTFNVSTAAAFVVAACGLPVAKHGNVGVTSKSGSADVLRALGVKVDLPPERVEAIFDEIDICFLFAPMHHAATRRVAMVRRELGVRTIFNLLGPLTNPAGAPFQVAGVSDEAACEKMARALLRLGVERAWIVRGIDGLDEVSLSAATYVYEADSAGVTRFVIMPEDFGLSRAPLDSLRGGSAEENAAIIRDLFEGRRAGPARDLVLLNAAASLYVAGLVFDFKEAVAMASRGLDSGGAREKLDQLHLLSNQ